MPKTKVEIEWDKPKDKNWLNVYNVKIALGAHCKNTKFRVRDLEFPYNVSEDQPKGKKQSFAPVGVLCEESSLRTITHRSRPETGAIERRENDKLK